MTIPTDGREQIARIIEPRAYELRELGSTYHVTGEMIDAALAKADAILALLPTLVGGWRPIETAPKDGTLFLTWDGHGFDLTRWLTVGDKLFSVNGVANTATQWHKTPSPPTEGV